MEKTITIDGKEVRFKATASFPLIYKANFNVDILTIIMPLLSEVIGGAEGMFTDGMATLFWTLFLRCQL